MAAFVLQWQSWTVKTETILPAEPKLFTIWPPTEKVWWPLFSRSKLLTCGQKWCSPSSTLRRKVGVPCLGSPDTSFRLPTTPMWDYAHMQLSESLPKELGCTTNDQDPLAVNEKVEREKETRHTRPQSPWAESVCCPSSYPFLTML